MTQEEIKELKEKALKQFLSGESLTGKDGAFAPMLKEFMEGLGSRDVFPSFR